ncbi:MAG: ATP-dependent Clp protease proteolytic subunit [Planctomycetota bacterium]
MRRIVGSPIILSLALLMGGPALAQDDAHGAAAATKPADQHSEKAATEQEKSEMEQLREELARLKVEYEIIQARSRLATAEAETREKAIKARQALRNAEQAEELAELRAQAERLRAESSLQSAVKDRELSKMKDDAARVNAENAKLAAEVKRAKSALDLTALEYAAKTAELDARLGYLKKTTDARDKVLSEVAYPANPVIDGTLYISDRRIPLNGVITTGTATYVTERIHFFNNQSNEAPIFIVIDDCPGGSVMEGYRIVKAIESSRAPIHVVVKSFAASMAAVITTLADHSHAYPNAIILHHQMSYGISGNMTQHRERLEQSTEWMRRLAEPVAAKMGVTLDRFVEMMYENDSDGDWTEFADQAVELKWVNNVVDEIREDGVIARPTSPRFGGFFLEYEQVDPTTGQRFVRLPVLANPFDFYAMYDPNDYWRE